MSELEQILKSANHRQVKRAVALIDGMPLCEDLVREAFRLGQEVAEDKVNEQLKEYVARIDGLDMALEAKNEIRVIHTSGHDKFLWFVLLLVLALEIYRLYV